MLTRVFSKLQHLLVCQNQTHWADLTSVRAAAWALRCAGWKGFTLRTCDHCGEWIITGGARTHLRSARLEDPAKRCGSSSRLAA